MADKTVYWQSIAGTDIFITVHDVMEPTNEEWDALLEDWRTHCEPIVAAGRQPISFNWTIGGSPDAAQRKRLKEITDNLGSKPPRAAVMTNSRFARGVVTALRWLGAADVCAFDLGSFEAACSHLGISGKEVERLSTALGVLSKKCSAAA